MSPVLGQKVKIRGSSGGALLGAKMHLGPLFDLSAFSDAQLPVGYAVDWDDNSFVDGDTFVIPEDGRYWVEGRANFYLDSPATEGLAILSIRNESLLPAGDYDRQNVYYLELNYDDALPKCTVLREFAAGDILTLWAVNSTDATLNVNTNIAAATYLAITKIG